MALDPRVPELSRRSCARRVAWSDGTQSYAGVEGAGNSACRVGRTEPLPTGNDWLDRLHPASCCRCWFAGGPARPGCADLVVARAGDRAVVLPMEGGSPWQADPHLRATLQRRGSIP